METSSLLQRVAMIPSDAMAELVVLSGMLSLMGPLNKNCSLYLIVYLIFKLGTGMYHLFGVDIGVGKVGTKAKKWNKFVMFINLQVVE